MEKKQRKTFLMKPVQQFLTLERAAKLEGVSSRTIYRRLRDNKTNYVKVDGQIWISLPEKKIQKPSIEDFIKYKDEEISLREASRKTGVPNQTISKWVHSGKLQFRKDGRFIFIPLNQMMYAAALYNYVKTVHGSTWGIDIFAA